MVAVDQGREHQGGMTPLSALRPNDTAELGATYANGSAGRPMRNVPWFS
jgi:hypothetical protein